MPGSTGLHSSPLTCGNAFNERCYDGLGDASTATELHPAGPKLLFLGAQGLARLQASLHHDRRSSIARLQPEHFTGCLPR